ncbi:50S ribosomal protein L25/general stress protein Ctc [Nesterenkonia sp. F]|uniref:50S ribosomal protein L25/general stress protein Ctc n=1 Tax=Nesterenkonia sp. F TaxID=795955 RepID=UPI000255C8DF|nr:50S ribosomal protein L25/general stress protein Ctc [Nesterenkonia sp. F]
MSDKIVIQAHLRSDFGKGAARRARREGWIPAVVYGHGEDPQHLLLPKHETTLAVRNPNALITLDIEGKDQMVLPKDIQRDAIYRSVDHLDLIVVRRGEKVVVDVTVEVIGEPAAGLAHLLDQPTVSVEAEATHLPESVSIDITDRTEHALPELLQLPKGTTLALSDLESPIVTIYEPAAQDLGEDEESDEDEDEAAEASSSEESGEGEGSSEEE